MFSVNQVEDHKGPDCAEVNTRWLPEGNNKDKMLSQDYKIKVNLKTIREMYSPGMLVISNQHNFFWIFIH